MRREDFDHAVRAAGAVLGEREVLVIGSQAIHASVPEGVPEEALRSVEVDVAAFDDAEERKADLVDGSIGEGSMFHATFGYYAQGVSEAVAILPAGWRERLVPYESPDTGGVTAGAWSPTTCGSLRRPPGARRTSSSAAPSSIAGSLTKRPSTGGSTRRTGSPSPSAAGSGAGSTRDRPRREGRSTRRSASSTTATGARVPGGTERAVVTRARTSRVDVRQSSIGAR